MLTIIIVGNSVQRSAEENNAPTALRQWFARTVVAQRKVGNNLKILFEIILKRKGKRTTFVNII